MKHVKLACFHILEPNFWSVTAFQIKKSPFKHSFIGQTLIIGCVCALKNTWLGQCPFGCHVVLECFTTIPAGGLRVAPMCFRCPATLKPTLHYIALRCISDLIRTNALSYSGTSCLHSHLLSLLIQLRDSIAYSLFQPSSLS